MTSGYVAAAIVFALLGCGKTVSSMAYEKVGTTQQTSISIPPGTHITLAVSAESYSYSGQNHVMLDAELLKGTAVVERMSCEGFEFEGGAGSGCKATHYNSSCAMTIPAGGADAIRVATRMQNGNSATIEGLQVLVRQ